MNSKIASVTTVACVLLLGGAEGFVAPASNVNVNSNTLTSSSSSSSTTSTTLYFGLPNFQPKKKDDSEKEADDKKIDAKGMIQLITAGLGAPFLGDFEGVDKESGKFMFSLEANNLVDENGKSKQTSMPYFESGWVDPEELERAEKRKAEGFKFPWQK